MRLTGACGRMGQSLSLGGQISACRSNQLQLCINKCKRAQVALTHTLVLTKWKENSKMAYLDSTLRTISIQLPSGDVSIVDEQDADLAQRNWRHFGRYIGYSVTKDYQVDVFLLHRIILERILGRQLNNGEYCDHINGDGADNRRLNLRLATHAENMKNRKVNKNSKTGFKGVRPHRKKFRATIVVNGNRINLGSYETPEMAAKAYDEAAIIHHGKFAKTNF